MTRTKRSLAISLALAIVTMGGLGAGCAVDTSTEEGEGMQQQALDNHTGPAAGESCHVVDTGVSNGTMRNDGWCCGVSRCNDRELCGDEYGHYTPTCSSCTAYICGSGPYRIVTTPPKPRR